MHETIPALETERCNRHRTEFNVWQTCPMCRDESENFLRASHFARQRFEADANLFAPGNLLRIVNVEEEIEDEESGRARKGAVLAFWAIVLLVDAFVLWCVGYARGWWAY